MEKGGAEPLSGPEVRACESVEGRGSDRWPVVTAPPRPDRAATGTDDWREGRQGALPRCNGGGHQGRGRARREAPDSG